MNTPILLYGSYGYTGSLIADLAVKSGMQPILAGRNEKRLKEQADRLRLPYHHVHLENPRSLSAAMEQVPVVLNCAGPFSRTYRPVVQACLKLGRHYLDITGEIAVFEALAGLDTQARQAGVMLLPGVGMDVVPSDCLAVHLKQRLPSASHLTLALAGLGGGISRGTAYTSVEGLGKNGLVRRDSQLVYAPLLGKTRQIDFGRGSRTAVNIPWGDVSTAYYSTGIPNIETYMVLPGSLLRWVKIFRPLISLGRWRWVQGLLHLAVRAMPAGPTEAARQHGQSRFWGEVRDEQGNMAVSRLETMDGYTLTSQTALEVARRVLQGDFKPGFQTPSRIYGADFILQFPGTVREDL